MKRRKFIALDALPLPSGERVGVRGVEAHRETLTPHPTPLPMGEGAERAGGIDRERRAFISLITAAASSSYLSWPRASRAQQPRKVPHIGVLLAGTPASFSLRAQAFRNGLQDLGYVEGKTIAIEWKWGYDRVEGLPELAAQLVGLNVEVIVTGGTPAAKALKNATRTTPIIMAIIGDPVAAGLVDSLARPGGNATGFSIVAPELGGKRLQLLKEIVPGISSVAVISNVSNPQSQIELSEMQVAAQTLDLQLYSIQISAESSLEDAFEKLSKQSIQALIVLTDAILYSQRSRIVALAARKRLPAMYFFREFVQEGGLMSYAPSDRDLFRRAATYVDRVLKGANPGDLPVEQPTKFELIINLKTAKALGLAIPDKLIALADEVIE